MHQPQLLTLIAELTKPARRREAARALAECLGADDLLVFVQDPEVGTSLPAPGFPQTLPSGRTWQAFVKACIQSGRHSADLPFPDANTHVPAVGIATERGTVIVLLGGDPNVNAIAEAQTVLSLLEAVLQGEQAAVAAAGHAAAARAAAANAQELAEALDAARRELHEALCAADREIVKRKQAEEEITRLLEAEKRYSWRLGQVAAASQKVNAARSVESVLQTVTEEARRIIGAHLAISGLMTGQNEANTITSIATSSKYDSWRDYRLRPHHAGIGALVCRENRPLRLTNAELDRHPACKDLDPEGITSPPLHGVLAVPFIGSSGRNLGLIQLSDKEHGEFTADDEVILVQLVNVASVAIENAKLYDELREADRRKDQFLAMLAHELRNPLAPIRSGLELLALETSGDGGVIELIQNQVGHLVRLVDDLLDVSRIIQGRIELRREPVELSTIIQQSIDAARPSVEAQQQTLHVFLPGEPLWLDADLVRLVQVLENLLNNASKYTERGGNIWLSAAREQDAACIRVEDSGVGIEPELLPRIFDLFTQSSRSLDRSQGGLGIGLTLVRNLVEMHQGSVAASSEGIGKGSRFEIRLPLIPSPRSTPTTESTAPAVVERRRVLIVDDNLGAAKMLSLLVRRLGPHDVQVAHDGLVAIERAKEFRPEIILLDIGLPKMDGLMVARKLRQIADLDDALLVALTGYGQEEDRRRSAEAGFDEHLVKPVDVETLRRLLSHPKLSARSTSRPLV